MACLCVAAGSGAAYCHGHVLQKDRGVMRASGLVTAVKVSSTSPDVRHALASRGSQDKVKPDASS